MAKYTRAPASVQLAIAPKQESAITAESQFAARGENRASAAEGRAFAATEFAARNLFEMTPSLLVQDGTADKWLVDPPREGAFALAKAAADLAQGGCESWQPPQRIVYVSCNPATLARDAGLLVHQAGYVCSAAGVIDMFPHTAHVESIAVFNRDASG